MEHNGEDEFDRRQEKMTLSYLYSQEEKVVDPQDGNMERTRGSASRIIELGELLVKVTGKRSKGFVL